MLELQTIGHEEGERHVKSFRRSYLFWSDVYCYSYSHGQLDILRLLFLIDAKWHYVVHCGCHLLYFFVVRKSDGYDRNSYAGKTEFWKIVCKAFYSAFYF